MEEARKVAEKIGAFPVIIRPAYTLGGTGGGIAYNSEEFEVLAKRGIELSPVSEILIEESLIGGKSLRWRLCATKRITALLYAQLKTLIRWASILATL
jgi:carbamoyl-phosphate synthase large subunit